MLLRRNIFHRSVRNCHHFAQMCLFAAFFGLCIAVWISLMSIVLCNILGLDRLTNAFGLLMMTRGIATLIGGPLAGLVYDATKTYYASFHIGGGMLLLGGSLCCFLFLPCLKEDNSSDNQRLHSDRQLMLVFHKILRLLRSRCTLFKAVYFSVAFCLVAYNEYFCFKFKRFQWMDLESPNRTELFQLRVLFVADPQIVGIMDEPPFIGVLTRFDCDRYLKSGFDNAFNHVLPDVVIFLGDLIDEGSKSSKVHYETYVTRFNNIFDVPSHVTKIYIPGDNDVGGEGIDLKESWKVERFKKYFDGVDREVVNVKFVDFFKLSYDYGEGYSSQAAKLTGISKAAFRVLLNHMGLIERHDNDYQAVVTAIRPNLIVTAHTHHAALYKCSNCRTLNDGKTELPVNITSIEDNAVHNLDVSDLSILYELMIPTCSYRMGVPDMGYGAAIFDSRGRVSFNVLWLPSRYNILYSYVIFLILSVILFALRLILAPVFPLFVNTIKIS